MTGPGPPTSGPEAPQERRHLGSPSRVVAASTLTTIVSSGPAAGDQVSDLKAQAAAIARDLVLEQLQIDAYQQQYDVDGAKVARDAIGIEATEHQISADTGRVGRDRKRLEGEAVSAYINLDPQSEGTQVLFEGNQTDAFARARVRRCDDR
jgi:hypothetical protein